MESHIAEICSQGVDFAPADVLDRNDAYVKIPVKGGVHVSEIEVCRAMLEDYGGIVVLSNFRIPSFVGYTGAVKNIGIGLVSPDAKALMHDPGYERSEAFLCNLADVAKGVQNFMGSKMISLSLLSGANIGARTVGGAEPQKGSLRPPLGVGAGAVSDAPSVREKIDSGYLQLENLARIGAGSRACRLVEI